MPFPPLHKESSLDSEKSLFYTTNSSFNPTKTLLLIHGLGSSSCFYAPITPLLTSSSSVRCIAFDAHGSGLSSNVSQEQSIETLAHDALKLLDALDVQERVVVVGHSLGGIVASTFAAKNPERVKGVVLLGPVNPSPALAEPFGKRIEVVKEDGLEPLADSIPTAATGSKSTPLQHAFIRSLILGTSPEGYIRLCECIAQASKPDYASIKVPLLLLAGAEDKTAPLESSKVIVDAYGTESSEKKLEILEGVGHWHCVEASEEVAKHIAEFVGKLR